MLTFFIHKEYIRIIRVRRVLILEEFLVARPRQHRQRVTFLEVTAAADIILPFIDVLLHFVDTYMLFRLWTSSLQVLDVFYDCVMMYFMIVLMDGYFYVN
jgi:hypothetical protein